MIKYIIQYIDKYNQIETLEYTGTVKAVKMYASKQAQHQPRFDIDNGSYIRIVEASQSWLCLYYKDIAGWHDNTKSE